MKFTSPAGTASVLLKDVVSVLPYGAGSYNGVYALRPGGGQLIEGGLTLVARGQEFVSDVGTDPDAMAWVESIRRELSLEPPLNHPAELS